MNPENRPQESSPPTEDWQKRHDEFINKKRESATELQRDVAQKQAEMLELALYNIMQRTGNNPDIVNGLRDFIRELDIKGAYGASDKLLAPNLQEKLADFLRETVERLEKL